MKTKTLLMKTKTLLMKTKTLLMSRAAALPPFMKTKTFLMSSAAALALLIILISAAAFLSSGDSSVDSELCASEFAQGAYESAFRYCEKACSQNDGMSCNNLGQLYYNGDGVDRDNQQAKTYYEKSCSLDDGIGCFGLGSLYYNGYGVKQNKKVSKEYCRKACDLGLQDGCSKATRIMAELVMRGEDD